MSFSISFVENDWIWGDDCNGESKKFSISRFSWLGQVWENGLKVDSKCLEKVSAFSEFVLAQVLVSVFNGDINCLGLFKYLVAFQSECSLFPRGDNLLRKNYIFRAWNNRQVEILI